MPGRRSISEESVQQLTAAAKAARTAGDLRRALGVLLPEVFGLTRRQTAAALGCGTAGMDRRRRDFRRAGLGALRDRRRRPLPPGAAAELRAALGRATRVREYQRLLCVLLLEELGLEVVQVAALLGLRRSLVCTLQSRYRREGLAGLLDAARNPASGPRAAFPEGTAARLRAALKNPRGLTGFRQAQCLYLRIGLGFEASQVAEMVGWTKSAVHHLQERFRRQGDDALRGPGRGRARWRLLSVEREAAVLRRLAQDPCRGHWLMFPDIQQAFEQEAGHPVNPSVVQEILDRHHWYRAAVVMVPSQAGGG